MGISIVGIFHADFSGSGVHELDKLFGIDLDVPGVIGEVEALEVYLP